MVLLITGATHTGKTLLAQKLLEEDRRPYLSMDHVKMGLIRSGKTALTPYDDDRMTDYLWPVVREIVKTAVENRQDLIVEGCYVPADWETQFPPAYRSEIRFCCLAMTENYIRAHFDAIRENASAVESRGADADFSLETALRENALFRSRFEGAAGLTLIDDSFETAIEAAVRTCRLGPGRGKLLVSACLLGCPCRYDGGSCPDARVLALRGRYTLIPVCPEQLGGLATPRAPVERVKDALLTESGEDLTAAFEAGAAAALSLARLLGVNAAVLKAKSPSCGKGRIYDGSFTGKLVSGDGVTAALLLQNGIAVYTEEEAAALL